MEHGFERRGCCPNTRTDFRDNRSMTALVSTVWIVQHCSNWISGGPGELDVVPLAPRRFMSEAVTAGGNPELPFECAVEGRFRLVSHFAGDFRYTPRRVLQ